MYLSFRVFVEKCSCWLFVRTRRLFFALPNKLHLGVFWCSFVQFVASPWWTASACSETLGCWFIWIGWWTSSKGTLLADWLWARTQLAITPFLGCWFCSVTGPWRELWLLFYHLHRSMFCLILLREQDNCFNCLWTDIFDGSDRGWRGLVIFTIQ